MKLVLLLVVVSAAARGSVAGPKKLQLSKDWGPSVRPTRGDVWPRPRSIVPFHQHGYMALRTNLFTFNVTRYTCDIVSAAVTRYYRFLVLERDAGFAAQAAHRAHSNEIPSGIEHASSGRSSDAFRGNLDVLDVELMAPCEPLPYFAMDEHYELRIDSADVPKGGKLVSHTVWGILRGLETFVQLVAPSLDGTALHLNSCMISDYPRFPYRGLLIDTGRHFLPLPTIFRLVDGMEANKLNVLHWHLVDDQSFPYQSTTFPELSDKGAYHPLSHVYSQTDVKAVIEYCRLRGIRVIPEFDTPGHTRSWGEAHPELLTTCYGSSGAPDGSLGPMDPTKKSTYAFVAKFFREVANVFPDKFLHIGGDEVDFNCWKSNPEVNKYMQTLNISGNYKKLEGIYIDRVLKDVYSLNMSAVVWQEVFDNRAGTLNNDTMVHVWKPYHYMADMQKVTASGHLALLSACWYLDNLGKSWIDMYECEPQNFTGTPQQLRLVQGGEACMWGEAVDHTNVLARVFPRASGAAERLWSDAAVTHVHQAAPRLEEFRCKMQRRGVAAEPPNGPSFCPGETFNL